MENIILKDPRIIDNDVAYFSILDKLKHIQNIDRDYNYSYDCEEKIKYILALFGGKEKCVHDIINNMITNPINSHTLLITAMLYHVYPEDNIIKYLYSVFFIV